MPIKLSLHVRATNAKGEETGELFIEGNYVSETLEGGRVEEDFEITDIYTIDENLDGDNVYVKLMFLYEEEILSEAFIQKCIEQGIEEGRKAVV